MIIIIFFVIPVSITESTLYVSSISKFTEFPLVFRQTSSHGSGASSRSVSGCRLSGNALLIIAIFNFQITSGLR